MPVSEGPLEESVYDNPSAPGLFPVSAVQPESPSPAPLSTAPGFGGTPGNDGQAPEQVEPQDQEDPLPEFDSRWQDEFEGLLYIGALTEEFTWLGHRIVIRTLTTEEMAEIALASKPYLGTEAELKAYQAGVVAASVVTVDGVPLPAPLTTAPGDTPFSNRFRYVWKNWRPPVLDAIYQRYVSLEIKVREVIEAMGNHSG